MDKLRRRKVLNEPSYWVESINGTLYDAVMDYMEENKFNQKKLSQEFGLSEGRVSQLLNDGEINFTINKLVEIAVKIGKYPIIELVGQEEYLDKESKQYEIRLAKESTKLVYSTSASNNENLSYVNEYGSLSNSSAKALSL